jgi:hypothetical protein
MILTKNGLSYLLGDFLTNASGHPVQHGAHFVYTDSRVKPFVAAFACFVAVRVTRLGETSPNGRLFTLGNFFEKCRRSTHFCVTFFLSMDYELILTKNVLGYLSGDFLHKTHLVTLIAVSFIHSDDQKLASCSSEQCD